MTPPPKAPASLLAHRILRAASSPEASVADRGLRSVALSLLVSDLTPVGRDGATVLAQVLRRAAAGGIIAPRCGLPTDVSAFPRRSDSLCTPGDARVGVGAR